MTDISWSSYVMEMFGFIALTSEWFVSSTSRSVRRLLFTKKESVKK